VGSHQVLWYAFESEFAGERTTFALPGKQQQPVPIEGAPSQTGAVRTHAKALSTAAGG
jgi:hypothetical protein